MCWYAFIELDDKLEEYTDIFGVWSQYIYFSAYGRNQSKSEHSPLANGKVEGKTGDTKFVVINHRYCRFEIDKLSHILFYCGSGS